MRSRLIVPLLVAAVAMMAATWSTNAGADGTATTPNTTAGAPTTGVSVTSAAAATASAVRVSPPKRSVATTPAPGSTEGSASCPATGHAAIIDRANQRAWLCTAGTADPKFPVTTAVSQPKPGTYHVYAKDKVTTSTFGGHFSYLDNFVAFTYGTNTGARIAFHAVPRNAAGAPYQPLDTLGTPAYYGASSGCIRVLPAQSQVIWDFLAIGDTVIVIS